MVIWASDITSYSSETQVFRDLGGWLHHPNDSIAVSMRQPLQMCPDTLKKSCLEEARSIKSSARLEELGKLKGKQLQDLSVILATKDHPTSIDNRVLIYWLGH